MSQLQPTQAQAAEALWRAGVLRWKLDKTQQEMYDAFYSFKGRKFVINCSRRLGKSYFLCLLALEFALRIPDAQIKFAAPTQRQVKRVIFPIFRQLLKDCPADIKPEWFAQESSWDFPNGSNITIAGMDSGRSDALRGTDSHFSVVDEAAFSPSNYLEDMVTSVLLPMALLTNGKICIASTPPKVPRHAFEKYFNEAKLDGGAIHKTIYDNARISHERIDEFIKESGGKDTTVFRREYLAEFCVDEEIIVLPEFTRELQNEVCVQVERPSHYDCYTSLDLGMKDATGIVFLYYDFKNARIVVEEEALLHGVAEVRTDLIADVIRAKESQQWGAKKPYFRVSDIDPLLINDLSTLHNLQFVQADKSSKESAVNELRIMLRNKQIYINPRCKNLIAQLESCIWDHKREKFDRVSGFFHFDLVDALIYGMKSVRRQHNPYPADSYSIASEFFFSQPSDKTPTAKTLTTLFKPKRFGS